MVETGWTPAPQLEVQVLASVFTARFVVDVKLYGKVTAEVPHTFEQARVGTTDNPHSSIVPSPMMM